MVKILAIDSDRQNLLKIQTTVDTHIPGAKLLTSASGEDGLRKIKKLNPDVVLIDAQMPGTNGIELCRVLKSDIRTSAIPVLFFTAVNGDPTIGAQAIEAGGEGFLPKPVKESELLAQIRAMVKIKKTHLNDRLENKNLQKQVSKHTKQLNAELAARKKIEKALREKEQLLEQAQEIALLGSWELNLVKNTSCWSENNYRLFGFEPFEVIPSYQVFIDRVITEDRKLIKDVFEKVKNTRQPQKFEFRITTKNNEIKWLQSNLVPTFEKGNIVLLKGVSFDITERKQAEEKFKSTLQIAKEQEQFSKLNAEISTELIDVNLENVDQKIGTALAKIGEFARADRSFIFLISDDISIMDNTHEWCAPGAKSHIKKLKDIPVDRSSWWMKKLTQKEHIFIRQVEEIAELTPAQIKAFAEQEVTSLITVPIFKGDDFLGFIGFNSSEVATHWNDFHIQIIKAVANSIASALSSVKNQNQLLLAKEKAEESDRLKSAFLTNMSHEIRTPMNGIIGFLDLMRNTTLSEKEQNLYFSMVKKSSDRLMTTINNIIEIAKIEAGQSPLITSTENINEIITFLYSTFKMAAQEKGLLLKLTEDTEKNLHKTVAVKTDKLKLEIILKNLIENAIKFTSKGSVEFGYKTTKNKITFFVSDTGPGIAQNRMDAIFDRFVQADLNITRPYEGAGLGLSITRAYTEMLNGKIWIESETGKGSKFFFELNEGSLVRQDITK